ncbi:hypothetical protein [Paenibacillus chitinolyticus]|uniref:hypothetical protein n=1 Tax=Paenibacillus chitinolyticus TaxID=79263 RepID=UPI00366E1865
MKDDIQFLISLQAELNSQYTDAQAAPRFWTVGDYAWVECNQDNAERYSVYLPGAGESYEINCFLVEFVDREELSAEALEELEDVGCEDSAFDWIQKYEDEDATLHPERKHHIVRPNTLFLTKEEAKRHIEF